MTHSTFVYSAHARDGRIHRGVIRALSRDAAAGALGERGLLVKRLDRQYAHPFWKARVPLADNAEGLRLLASMLEGGLPLSRAVDALADVAPRSWQHAAEGLKEAIREGRSLAASLSDAPLNLPPVVLGLIRAGESSNGLWRAVHGAAELLERQAATRAAISGALAYPIVLAASSVISAVVLGGFVLPRFAELISQLGQSVPTSTAFVLWIAQGLQQVWLLALISLSLGAAFWWQWRATENGRRAWHELLLRIPVVRDVRSAMTTARVTGAMAALYDAGVAMSAVVTLAAHAAGDAAIAARLEQARADIADGHPLSASLKRTRAVSPFAVRLVAAGERGGRLGALLAQASRLEDERGLRAVRRAVRLLEPSLILIFGLAVAVIAAALLQALYSVRPAL
jgi:general secretion pathway protein F